ncbi:MAG: excinuclease ABC subunit B [Blastochloris sp.]|nr:excinuclease ABC subunit B [Blastochloris sp.]
MQCEKCQSEKATVFLTQIINGKMHKIDLCERCAKEMGVTNASTFSLADLLIKTEAERQNRGATSTLSCPACGFTQEDLSKTGRVGCGQCYVVFQEALGEALKDMQRSLQHCGKVPERHQEGQESLEQCRRIEDALEEAVRKENYEVAAALRDQLKTFKKG